MSLLKQKTRLSERITLLQSEKVIHSILSMSLGCIAFLRGFFDDDHFIDSKFVVPRNDIDPNAKKDSIKVKTLKRGKSAQSDILLNWLDKPIIESIHKKYLKAINLSILLDDKDPENVFESYCFKISYDENITTISFSNDNIGISPLTASRKQIHQLLKRFIVITQSLPNLPSKRFLSMRLMFNKNCPSSYQPDLFIDCSNEKPATLKVPIDLLNDIDISNCGDMSTNHHQFLSKIISLSTLDLHSMDFTSSNFKYIDPFDLLEEEKMDGERNDIEISQLTKELQKLANDENLTEDEFQSTQKFQLNNNENDDSGINCSCGSTMYLPFTSNIQCCQCFQLSHAVCHSIPKNQPFKCPLCENEEINPDMLIIFNIRKIIALLNFQKKPNFPSISKLFEKIGYNIDNKNDLNYTQMENLVINSISVLIYEKILLLKKRKTFSYMAIEIDKEGILWDNKPIIRGKYFIQYNDKNENIRKFLDPDLGKIQNEVHENIIEFDSIKQILENSENDLTDIEDPENIENLKLLASQKKRKISKSLDIFQV